MGFLASWSDERGHSVQFTYTFQTWLVSAGFHILRAIPPCIQSMIQGLLSNVTRPMVQQQTSGTQSTLTQYLRDGVSPHPCALLPVSLWKRGFFYSWVTKHDPIIPTLDSKLKKPLRPALSQVLSLPPALWGLYKGSGKRGLLSQLVCVYFQRDGGGRQVWRGLGGD